MIFRPKTFGLGVFFVCLCHWGNAAEPLFSATYSGKYSGWNFETTRQLIQQDATTYLLEAQSSQTFASLTETSRFGYSQGHFTPLEYHYSLNTLGINRSEHLQFNAQQNKTLSTSSKNKDGATWVDIHADTLDPALYQLKMQQDFAQSQNLFRYEFIKRKDIKTYVFKKTSEETLTINQQAYATVVLERQDTGPNKSTRVWLLKDFPYLIARIQHREKPGETYTIELKNFKVAEPELKAFYLQKAVGNKP